MRKFKAGDYLRCNLDRDNIYRIVELVDNGYSVTHIYTRGLDQRKDSWKINEPASFVEEHYTWITEKAALVGIVLYAQKV